MASTTTAITVKKILVPTDFSEISLHALDYAAEIARLENAEILLLHVFESYNENTMLDMRVDFTDIVERGIESKFSEIKKNRKNLDGVAIHSKVVLGKIHSEIDRLAAEENIRLMVMGTHGVSGITNIGKFILGSNAYRTIHNAPCPIITIREEPRRKGINNIVMPLDSTSESTRKVEIVARWAKFFKATVHILAITGLFEELRVDIKQIREKVQSVENYLNKEGVKYEANVIRHQAPSESVLEYSAKVNADLIFIVTGQESQLAEMLLGSSARTIISDSMIPVMSINTKKYREW